MGMMPLPRAFGNARELLYITIYSFSRASISKHHRLCDFNSRNVLSQSSVESRWLVPLRAIEDALFHVLLMASGGLQEIFVIPWPLHGPDLSSSYTMLFLFL